MTERDFQDFGITCVTSQNVIGTGAALADVSVFLIIRLQRYADLSGRRFVLLPNGLTSGQHSSSYHKRGMAADISWREANGSLNIYQEWKGLIGAGFGGIGLYFNGTAYSAHVDLRPKLAFWAGWKRHGENIWTMGGLFKDPRKELE